MLMAAWPPPSGGASVAPAALPFRGHGSIGEAYVVGATPGEHLTVRRRDRGRRRVRCGRPPGQPHRAQPHPGVRLPFRGGRRGGRAPHRSLLGAVHGLDAGRVALLLPAPSRRAQLRAHARRGPPGGDRAPPAGQDPGRRTVPDGDRVLRLRRGRPAQPDRRAGREEAVERPSPPRYLDRRRLGAGTVVRLRHRERPDAWHRLLGRGLRPVRPPVGLRRLRRGADRGVAAVGPAPQGRHGRDLLLGLLPAGRRRHQASGPGRRHATQPHRRPVLDRLSRRYLQRRVRRELGLPARGGRGAGAAGRPALGAGGDRDRGHDLPGQPAPARAGREPRLAREPGPGPDAVALRPALARGVGLAHHGARLPGRRAARTNRSVPSGPPSSPRCAGTRTSTSR